MEEMNEPQVESKNLFDPNRIRNTARSLREWSSKDSAVSQELADKTALYAGCALMIEGIAAAGMHMAGAITPEAANTVSFMVTAGGLTDIDLVVKAYEPDKQPDQKLKNSTHVIPWLAGKMDRLAAAIEKSRK